jgi:hypothetical protein
MHGGRHFFPFVHYSPGAFENFTQAMKMSLLHRHNVFQAKLGVSRLRIMFNLHGGLPRCVPWPQVTVPGLGLGLILPISTGGATRAHPLSP